MLNLLAPKLLNGNPKGYVNADWNNYRCLYNQPELFGLMKKSIVSARSDMCDPSQSINLWTQLTVCRVTIDINWISIIIVSAITRLTTTASHAISSRYSRPSKNHSRRINYWLRESAADLNFAPWIFRNLVFHHKHLRKPKKPRESVEQPSNHPLLFGTLLRSLKDFKTISRLMIRAAAWRQKLIKKNFTSARKKVN